MPPRRIAVCLEATPKQAFASALDWPGWCRAGRDEDAALKALASYAKPPVLSAPSGGSPVWPGGWTTRYAARRIAWHVLEHAWEMQDRTQH